MIFMIRTAGRPPAPGRGQAPRYHRRVKTDSMTLRLKINLIVGALTVLFVAAMLVLQLRSMVKIDIFPHILPKPYFDKMLSLSDRSAYMHIVQGPHI